MNFPGLGKLIVNVFFLSAQLEITDHRTNIFGHLEICIKGAAVLVDSAVEQTLSSTFSTVSPFCTEFKMFSRASAFVLALPLLATATALQRQNECDSGSLQCCFEVQDVTVSID